MNGAAVYYFSVILQKYINYMNDLPDVWALMPKAYAGLPNTNAAPLEGRRARGNRITTIRPLISNQKSNWLEMMTTVPSLFTGTAVALMLSAEIVVAERLSSQPGATA